jgi:hypothetical protein
MSQMPRHHWIEPFLADFEQQKGIFIWSLVLVGFVILLFFGIVLFKRWLSDAGDSAPAGPAFTLDDLRDLRRKGLMTDAEFEKAKAKLIASAQGPVAKDEGPDKSDPNRPGA